MSVLLSFTIPLRPITKKNNGRIVNKGSRRRVIPSEAYVNYEANCGYFIKKLDKPIDCKINIKAIYYIPGKYKVDITNLHNALHDILVHYGVIKDDNCKIVLGTDGSRVKVDKQNPRTEVTITTLDEVTGYE